MIRIMQCDGNAHYFPCKKSSAAAVLFQQGMCEELTCFINSSNQSLKGKKYTHIYIYI